ncbi:MAG: DUF2093 domain-containing protein [Hyphomicrobiaceae bacterium]
MDRFDRMFGFKSEARVRYLDSEYQVMAPGDFVRCAITGKPIPLSHLKYWSVERQEAYASAEVAMQRALALRTSPNAI